MNTFTTVILFVILFFVYIHVVHQYKKSNDLEVYEFDYTGNQKLQEICEVRQPVVFLFEPILNILKEKENVITDWETIANTFDTIPEKKGDIQYFLNVKDSHDNCDKEQMEVSLSLFSALQLIKSKNHFFTENNETFLINTGLKEDMETIGNIHLKPTFCMIQTMDILGGGTNVETPFRFHTNTRKFLYIGNGNISVKMTTYKNAKKIGFKRCRWNDYSKIRFLEFDVSAGNMVYIPPYWFYSIKFHSNDVCVFEYNYQTAMNVFAHPQCILRPFISTISDMFVSSPSEEVTVLKKEDDDDDIAGAGSGSGSDESKRKKKEKHVKTAVEPVEPGGVENPETKDDSSEILALLSVDKNK